MKESQPTMASNYLSKVWRRETGREETPPLDLHEAVVHVVMIAGYTKTSIDQMVTAYLKRSKEQS